MFYYRTLRQAALAALRIYGEQSTIEAKHEAFRLYPVRGLTVPMVDAVLGEFERDKLVKRMGNGWAALPSRVRIGEV